jgi:dienelactone hydrolase
MEVVGSYEPRGRITTIGNLEVYDTGSSAPIHERSLLLLLPDGFGLARHNIILADRFAQAGWHVLVPDYFEGRSIPSVSMHIAMAQQTIPISIPC